MATSSGVELDHGKIKDRFLVIILKEKSSHCSEMGEKLSNSI